MENAWIPTLLHPGKHGFCVFLELLFTRFPLGGTFCIHCPFTQSVSCRPPISLVSEIQLSTGPTPATLWSPVPVGAAPAPRHARWGLLHPHFLGMQLSLEAQQPGDPLPWSLPTWAALPGRPCSKPFSQLAYSELLILGDHAVALPTTRLPCHSLSFLPSLVGSAKACGAPAWPFPLFYFLPFSPVLTLAGPQPLLVTHHTCPLASGWPAASFQTPLRISVLPESLPGSPSWPVLLKLPESLGCVWPASSMALLCLSLLTLPTLCRPHFPSSAQKVGSIYLGLSSQQAALTL